MIFRPSSKITFVLYEDQRVAKCIEFSRKHLRLLFLVIPLILLSSILLALGLLAYVKDLNVQAQLMEPKILAKFQDDKKVLEDEIARLKRINEVNLEKITAGASTAEIKTDVLLPLFRPTLGFKNLTERKLLNVENINVSTDDNNVHLTFDIFNKQESGERLSGHIVAILKNGPQIIMYPNEDFNFDDAFTTFNVGEKFTISRFRPVKAMFPKTRSLTSKTFFKIYIFSRVGDLLYEKSIGPIEPK